MAAAAAIRLHKRSIVDDFCTPMNWIGGLQVLTTLLPLAAIWIAIALIRPLEPPAFALAVVCISLLLLRSFSLMHDCGHNSLFRSPALNRIFGFIFGLLTGMPQFVWAQHHNYHHAHNGNWAKYRGPLAILTVDEFRRLSPRRQRLYAATRTIWLAPLAGFLYLIVNPRLNWLRGTAELLLRLGARAIHRPKDASAEQTDVFQSRFWASRTEYWHMTANNLLLFALWAAACWAIGAATFFPVYLISVSLAGGAGIILFAAQHNFEHAYASGDEDWDYHAAAISGTSHLTFPPWLNWCTANIGYHHIHHLSARIPNYRLAACHTAHQHLFVDVKRLAIGDVRHALTYLLWDTEGRHLVSIREHRLAAAALTTLMPENRPVASPPRPA